MGFKDHEGKWTDLLGAVVQEEVDIALDTVIQTAEKSADMLFTYKIMKSMYASSNAINISKLKFLNFQAKCVC